MQTENNLQSPSRRQAVQTMSALTGAFVTLTQSKAAQEKLNMQVIDTHQHLWDLNKFTLPWLPKDGPLARSYSLADYRKATEGLGVANTVYMEVDVAENQQLAEAELVSNFCSDTSTGMLGAVISGRPSSQNFSDYVEKVKSLKGIRGLRQVLLSPSSTPSGFCLQKSFLDGIRLLGKKSLSYDICVKHDELPNVAKLVAACPETSFILDHCGNPDLKDKTHDSWKRGLELVAKHSNVVVKVSGFLASAPGYGQWNIPQIAPIINHTLDTFGPDRVLFAGDWPVVLLAASYSQWLGAVRQIVAERPSDQQKKLFHDNAIRIYKLA